MIIWRGTISGSGVAALLSASTVMPRCFVEAKLSGASVWMLPRKTFTEPLMTLTFWWRSVQSVAPPMALS
jgi:hypothetical protein